MFNKFQLIPALLLALGIILLYFSIKKRKNKEKRERIIIKANSEEESLKEITQILRKEIKESYNIDDRLSIAEIIKELEKKEIHFFIPLCKKIEEYNYRGKEKTKRKMETLKEELLKEIRDKRVFQQKQEELKKKNETLLEKIAKKEQELREKTRKQIKKKSLN